VTGHNTRFVGLQICAVGKYLTSFMRFAVTPCSHNSMAAMETSEMGDTLALHNADSLYFFFVNYIRKYETFIDFVKLNIMKYWR
jgi:hypothetical protein